ncbi:MAG TPA: hypothetical protein ENN51_01630 [candidate division WOR-3 bacterium]|uniref:DUF305 domain-containing protein n=1 Tax=candidate division WOR-3 bacterium TaxID=2052148 RepID=A0A7V0XEE0_UNCW3|nr:hypothetical protein [candidate division WOR-3 bacterium]
MKALKLAVAAVLIMTGLFCGGQEQAEQQPVERPAGEGFDAMPAVAFEEISEAEMDKFADALPDVGAALKAAGFTPEEREEDEIPDALARLVKGMGQVEGVEAALVRNNTNWPEFSATMYKVMAASAALGLEMALAMAEGFADESEEGKQMMAELEKARAFCERVPEENREAIMQNMGRLEALGDLN